MNWCICQQLWCYLYALTQWQQQQQQQRTIERVLCCFKPVFRICNVLTFGRVSDSEVRTNYKLLQEQVIFGVKNCFTWILTLNNYWWKKILLRKCFLTKILSDFSGITILIFNNLTFYQSLEMEYIAKKTIHTHTHRYAPTHTHLHIIVLSLPLILTHTNAHKHTHTYAPTHKITYTSSFFFTSHTNASKRKHAHTHNTILRLS